MINLVKVKMLKESIAANPENVLDIINDEEEIGVCITDSKGYYRAVNKRYCEIYGYKMTELINAHFSIVVPDAKREHLQWLHDKFIKEEFEILRNWEVKQKNGNIIKIQADAAFFNNILSKTPHKVTFVALL